MTARPVWLTFTRCCCATIIIQVLSPACAFVPPQSSILVQVGLRCRWRHDVILLAASASTSVVTVKDDVATLSAQIEECVGKGQDPEAWLCRLEALNSNPQPNRDPDFLGAWHVWYTNCPPPSNGQLGPFQGTASQIVHDATTRSYQNLLAVPPNDWLTATLDGVWEDWDGVFLDDDEGDKDDTKEKVAAGTKDATDWGANHWKVTFVRLKIALFKFVLVNKEFPPDTARVWRTSYLDDEIRIVRAGKTGRREDEVVFYTKRTPPPTS